MQILSKWLTTMVLKDVMPSRSSVYIYISKHALDTRFYMILVGILEGGVGSCTSEVALILNARNMSGLHNYGITLYKPLIETYK